MATFPGFGAQKQENPLTKFMRRPKMMLRLPSKGKYWPPNTIDKSENNEYEVYAMTIKDEIMAKTPDALLTGQAMANIIQSCVPSIKDAMELPGIDLDAALIAIRIATYGEKTTVTANIPGREEPMDFDIDLRPVLDNIIDNTKWEEKIVLNDELTAYIKPINYRLISRYALSTMEAGKLMSEIIVNQDLTQTQKTQMQTEAVERLTTSTLDQVISSIMRIDSPEGSVTDPELIAEFLNNCDKEIFKMISSRFDQLNEDNNKRMITVATPDDLRAQGLPETLSVDFNFDISSFFG
jgi:hypothetical protein